MDKNNEMAHPFKPGETANRAVPEGKVIHMEQAFHVGERAAARRRRLSTIGRVAAAAVLTTAGVVGLGKIAEGTAQSQAMDSYDAKMEQLAIENLYKADRFKDGKYEIVISNPDDNTELNLRAGPYIENNVLDWNQVDSIDGTKIPAGTNSFIIEDPLISTGQDPANKDQPADWISLDLTLKDGKNQRAFIFNGEQTSGHIQALESGAIKPLSQSTESDNLGNVTINPAQ